MLDRHRATSDTHVSTPRSHQARVVRVLWLSLHSSARSEQAELAGGLETYLSELAPRLAGRRVVVELVNLQSMALLHFLRSHGARYDLVHAHYWTSATAALHARGLGLLQAPILTTFHSLGAPRSHLGHPRVTTERLRAEEQVARSSDRIVASSKIERSDIQALAGAAAKVDIAPLGVDHTVFRPGVREEARQAIRVCPKARMVLFAGRSEPAKGLPILIESFSRLRARIPSAKLVIVGGKTTELGSFGALEPAVLVRGPVTQSALVSYYQAADVVAVPSRHETFGLVALEAMSTGVPVVGTRVGALPEIIQDGHTGFLVAVDDRVNLGSRLATLLDSPTLAQVMGRRSQQQSARLSWEATADRINCIYRDTLAESNASSNAYAL